MTDRDSQLAPLMGNGRFEESGAQAAGATMTRGACGGAILLDQRRWICRQAVMRWSAPAHLLVLTRSGGTGRTLISPEGCEPHQGRDRAGVFSFVPAGMARDAVYEDARLSYVALWVDPSFVAALVAGALPENALINRGDALLAALLGSLGDDLAAGVEFDDTYIEHIVWLCIRRLRALDRPRREPGAPGKLSAVTVKRIESYVDAHLAANLRLSDLAVVAGLAPDSFARRFKATTGLSPYTFIVERRMSRAEAELAGSGLPIAHLAAQLGFASQSHFTAMFRRRRGSTPQAYRESFS